MHLLLALRAFFRVLFGRPLPEELVPALPAPRPEARTDPSAIDQAVAERLALERAAMEKAAAEKAAAAAPKGPSPDAVAVRAIAVFQAEGRLLDFLSEDIDGYSDAEIGAAVREIHRGCKRALADHFTLGPVRSEDEESRITVPEGYDPAELRLVGNVVGKPPFLGTLKHKGWRVDAVRLPAIPEGAGAKVIVPAEVEL